MTLAATKLRAANQARSPEMLSGLGLWLKADAITGLNDDDAVTTWPDSSGNAWDATQGTAANKPTYKTAIQNGLPVLRFDGTADFLAANGAAGLFSGDDLAMSVLVVAKVSSVAVVSTFVGPGRLSTGTPLYNFTVSSASGGTYVASKRDDANTTVSGSSGASTANTNWHVLAYVIPGTTVGLWVDGTVRIAATTALNNGVTTIDQVGIGASHRNTPSGFLVGDIGEVLVYSRAVATDERQQLQRHLGVKWGIAVA